MRFRAGALVLGVYCLGILPSPSVADNPVDAGLLEFLGSVDTEDKGWHDYLARTDIDQVAKHAGNAHGNAPAPLPPVATAPASNSNSPPPPSPPAPANPPPQPVTHP